MRTKPSLLGTQGEARDGTGRAMSQVHERRSHPMVAQERVPVLIVGAGAAGLSLSLLLRQQGIATVVVERRADVSWYPRARNLNFRTLEVFRGLGLEPQVIAAGSHVSRMFRKETLASPQQEEFPDIDRALHFVDHPELLTPEPLIWYCPQSRLEPLLLATARQRGGDVRYNTELVSFTQDDQGVTATIADRTSRTSSVMRADYLAACDGAHSHVRDTLGVNAEGWASWTSTTSLSTFEPTGAN
jgi:putative polyketide hydroxylase